MTGPLFVYGTLCHLPLLEAVLGHRPTAEAARAAGHAVYWAEGQDFPVIVAEVDAVVEGLLVEGLDAADRARLDFYEGGFAYRTRVLTVLAPGGPVSAAVYFPDPGHWTPGAPWRLADWADRWGAVVTATATDVMALMGEHEAEAVAARRQAMLVRGASRVRAAADPAPATLRRGTGAGDVAVSARRQPYARFFAVEEHDLSYRRFGGGMTDVVTRAAFVSGDAVTVLPYDPARDRVLVVEQFRAGPFARGDRQPWSIEAIAGRIDPGETAAEAARREALEEAGLAFGALLPVASYYPSPGAKTEYLYTFVALADLPDGTAGTFGLAEEAEDIRGHLISFDCLMGLVASGEVNNGPLILTALWLQRERGRLRGPQPAAGSAGPRTRA